MKNLVVTELSLPVKLHRFGILQLLDTKDVQFYIPDWCYDDQLRLNELTMSDKEIVKRLVGQGTLKLASLSGDQIGQLQNLLNGCCSIFIPQTVAAVIFARAMRYTLVSENQPLRIISYQQLGISISSYESAAAGLLQDIVTQGINLNIELVHELI